MGTRRGTRPRSAGPIRAHLAQQASPAIPPCPHLLLLAAGLQLPARQALLVAEQGGARAVPLHAALRAQADVALLAGHHVLDSHGLGGLGGGGVKGKPGRWLGPPPCEI